MHFLNALKNALARCLRKRGKCDAARRRKKKDFLKTLRSGKRIMHAAHTGGGGGRERGRMEGWLIFSPARKKRENDDAS